MGRMGATRLWVRSSSRCITLYGPIWQYVKKLVGGLEHEFYDFPFSWEFHDPN